MKIVSISIIDAFGEKGKNLKAEFNRDVTLLYGENGCGKTTLLNILSIIISGELYKLRNYQFSTIILKYSIDVSDNNELIIDKLIEKDKTIFKIVYNKNEHCIEIYDEREEFEYDERPILFFENNKFCKDINEIFNNIYLPLNRHDNYYPEDRYYRHGIGNYRKGNNNYLKKSMMRVEEILKNYIGDMNVRLSKVDDLFRKDVLGEMSSLEKEPPINRLFSEYKNFEDVEIQKTKESYVQALKINDIFNDNKSKQIDSFIAEFISELAKVKKDNEMNLNLAWMYFQYLKMKKVAEYSNKHDSEKENIMIQKNTFIETINKYFNEKEISITDNGDLLITKKTQLKNIDPLNLSSGEKQLLITFVTLYFGFGDRKYGVFIIDEPELSLHINWQRNLVSDLLKANNNIQYIYATHSPEIVSKYSDKMYEMI